ncbi:MAG: hypothetical protein ACLKAL_10975 [Alkaliphilus sp.]
MIKAEKINEGDRECNKPCNKKRSNRCDKINNKMGKIKSVRKTREGREGRKGRKGREAEESRKKTRDRVSKRIRNAINNKDGSSAVLACAIVLCLILLFTVISEYLRLQIIAQSVHGATQSAVISLAVENYDDVFTGLREGYSGGFELDSRGRWNTRIDEGAVFTNLSTALGLVNGRRYSGDRLEYTLSDLVVNIKNTSFAQVGNTDKFTAEVWITLEMPLTFGWERLPPLRIRMRVRAGYTAKF